MTKTKTKKTASKGPSKKDIAALERAARREKNSASRAIVAGFARGVSVDSAIEDAIIRAGTPNREKYFALRDVQVHFAGGFSGAKTTRVILEFF